MPAYITPFVTLAVGTSAYAANDALGAKFQFDLHGIRRGTIMSAMVINQNDTPGSDNLDIVLFSADITGTAANAAFDPTDAELATSVGAILVDTWKVYANNEMGVVDNIGLPFYAPAAILYAQCVLRAGTPTYADDDIRVALGIIY